jgi:uncharacterized membrane protein YfcA
MFGLGGGVVFVPVIMFILDFMKVSSEHYMHMVIGTSLSCVFITTINSTISHYKRDNINWADLKKLIFGVVLGVIFGSQIASLLPSYILKWLFAFFLTFVAFKMWRGLKVELRIRDIRTVWYWLAGFIIGLKSSLLGIGGGTISVPFLNWTGRSMKQAVGVSASLGLVISTFGTVSYIVHGLRVENLPQYSLGYVYLPAFIGISLMSSIFAHIGVKITDRYDQNKLKKAFAVLLLGVVIKTYWSLIAK